MVTIKQNLVPSSKYNIKCPYTRTPTRVVIHNTANDAPASNEISYMRNNNAEVSFHYAVDDKEIVQGIPDNRNAWASGDGHGEGNMEGIHIEICYSKSGGAKFTAAEKNAAEFAAYLLKKYGWGVNKLTKHQDYDGKYCPHRTLDLGWARFVNMVKSYLGTTTDKPSNSNGQLYRVRKSWDDAKSQIGAFEILDNAKKVCEPGYTVYDKDGKAVYTVKNTDSSNNSGSTTGYTGDITYRAYVNGKWLSSIVNYGEGSNGYAGIYGSSIQGLKIDAKNCDVYYRVHLKGGSWLSEVKNSGSGSNGYAGIYGKDIDGVQIRVPQGHVDCRVHIKGGDWLDWVEFKNKYQSGANGYAGIYGKSIDGIQMA